MLAKFSVLTLLRVLFIPPVSIAAWIVAYQRAENLVQFTFGFVVFGMFLLIPMYAAVALIFVPIERALGSRDRLIGAVLLPPALIFIGFGLWAYSMHATKDVLTGDLVLAAYFAAAWLFTGLVELSGAL